MPSQEAMMDWFVWKDKEQVGPVSRDAVQAMVTCGEIKPSTLLWHADMAKWTVAARVPGIGMPAAPSPASSSFAPSEGRKPFGATEPAQAVPAQSRPAYSAAAQPLPVHYAAPGSGWTNKDAAATAAVGDIAGPWARFWARNLDILVSSLLVGVVAGIVAPSLFLPGSPIESGTGNVVFGLIVFPLSLVVDAALYALFGNTLGKFIAGVKVLTCDGLNLTFSAYLYRNLTMYVRGYAFGIPIVYLGTLIYSWRKASRGELLGWDVATQSACVGTGDGVLRNFITAGLMIAIAALFASAG